MASRGTAVYAYYWALDATGVPVSGDVANHTLKWDKDGTPSTPTNAAAECLIGATGNGQYKVLLTTAEATCNGGQIIGLSATSGVRIIGQPIFFEMLPTALKDGRVPSMPPPTSGNA